MQCTKEMQKQFAIAMYNRLPMTTFTLGGALALLGAAGGIATPVAVFGAEVGSLLPCVLLPCNDDVCVKVGEYAPGHVEHGTGDIAAGKYNYLCQ